jgi:hypothetical protein
MTPCLLTRCILMQISSIGRRWLFASNLPSIPMIMKMQRTTTCRRCGPGRRWSWMRIARRWLQLNGPRWAYFFPFTYYKETQILIHFFCISRASSSAMQSGEGSMNIKHDKMVYTSQKKKKTTQAPF